LLLKSSYLEREKNLQHNILNILDDSNKPIASKNENPGNCPNIERNCSDGPVKGNLTFFSLLLLLNRFMYIRMGLKKKLKNPSVASLKKYIFLLYSRIILSAYSLVNYETGNR
jgi:hypothetical protein